MRTLALLLALLYPAAALAQSAPRLDSQRIERLTAAHGTWNDSGTVFKVSVPRDDVAATLAGVKLAPALGITSWAAFERGPEGALVMGDIVVLETQVNPVLDAALEAGLEVTALHNHFLWDQPRIFFLHIAGQGGEEALAASVGKVLARERVTRGTPAPVPPAVEAGLTPAVVGLEQVLGAKAQTAGGAVKFVWERKTSAHGVELGAAMGVNTWAAFAGSDSAAVVDGDFAVAEPELQTVLKALRRGGLQIAAIHSHMAMETPRVLFVHYLGTGPAADLAHGVSQALAAQRAASH